MKLIEYEIEILRTSIETYHQQYELESYFHQRSIFPYILTSKDVKENCSRFSDISDRFILLKFYLKCIEDEQEMFALYEKNTSLFLKRRGNYKIKFENQKSKEEIKEDLTYFHEVLETLKELNEFVQSELKEISQFSPKISNEIALNKVTNPINQSQTSKITWLRNKSDLVALFEALWNLQIISYTKNKDELISQHFNWLDGEIESRKLKHLRKNIKSIDTNIGDEVKNIIDKLKDNHS
jgi:hypothetical protein